MAPNFAMLLNQEAVTIFAIIDGFLRGEASQKRSSALESFPQGFNLIPWRRVYKPLEAQSATYQIMERWEASELSFGGAGTLWCFTELPRNGENISRKTEDGQIWSSRSGRSPKNGFPDQIRVDKLVISGKAFHMLELTLNQQEKPIVALCKIWRKGSAAASPQTPKPNASPGASTSLQVFEDHFCIHEGPTEMPIDQHQGQIEGIAPQQHMADDLTFQPSGDTEIPDSTWGFIDSIEPDDDSTYQDAVSFLHKMKGSFTQVAIFRKDEARKIASTVQNAAASLKNVLKSLRINAEPESPRPCTSNSAQLMEPASTAANNPAALAPEMMAQDEFSDQELAQVMEGSFFDVGLYLHLDGGNSTDFNPDQATRSSNCC